MTRASRHTKTFLNTKQNISYACWLVDRKKLTSRSHHSAISHPQAADSRALFTRPICRFAFPSSAADDKMAK
jgi:hypothetical protein